MQCTTSTRVLALAMYFTLSDLAGMIRHTDESCDVTICSYTLKGNRPDGVVGTGMKLRTVHETQNGRSSGRSEPKLRHFVRKAVA